MVLWFKNFAATIAAILKTFFEINKNKNGSFLNLKNSAAKVSFVGVKYSFYYWLDWVIFGAYGSIVILLKYYNFHFIIIFLILWLCEVIIASLFLIFNKATGVDITLGENLREAWGILNHNHKIIGFLIFIVLVAKLVFWDGSERASGFFMKETDTKIKMIFLIILVSGTKMIVYTYFFSMGYEIFI